MRTSLIRAGITALAVAGAITAMAVPAGATIRPAADQNTEGCVYELTTGNINMFQYPGGPATGIALQQGNLIFSAPRTVTTSGGLTYVFGVEYGSSQGYGGVGFVNKQYLDNTSCRTGANS